MNSRTMQTCIYKKKIPNFEYELIVTMGLKCYKTEFQIKNGFIHVKKNNPLKSESKQTLVYLVQY